MNIKTFTKDCESIEEQIRGSRSNRDYPPRVKGKKATEFIYAIADGTVEKKDITAIAKLIKERLDRI